MTIKNQLRLFLFGIVLIPLICVTFFPMYNYLTRPEKLLMTGSKMANKLSEYSITERDVDVLRKLLSSMPPKIEFILIANHSNVLLTNFPEFQEKKILDEKAFLKYIKDTSSKYFYQIVTPYLEDSDVEVFLVSRINRTEKDEVKHEKKWDRMLNVIILFLIIFETFCVSIVIYISNTITNSITILEKNTERVSSGELDVKFERKAKNDNEITHLTENLEKMRLTIKDDIERRSRFIMGISHDLRTPVAVIKGYTEAMSDGVFAQGEMNKALEVISSKTEQLGTMINTLINFVKLNQTEWQEKLKKQKIAPIIREFAENSVITGGVFKRNVSSNILVSDEIEIPFDTMLVQRALENLFTNAVRYTKNGDYIKIEANCERNKINLRIFDTGIGIDKKDLAQIFDMFYRGTNSRRESGMGIGLSVVKTIITIHGWKIDVKSQQNIGTEFIIEIPF